MTTLNLDHNEAQYQIRAYKPGYIKINEQIYERSLIISASEIITDWTPQVASDLTPDSLQPVIALQPAILLIGTGSKHELIPPSIYGELINHGIGVEVMDTSAACRTFNALTSENRHVVAALIIR